MGFPPSVVDEMSLWEFACCIAPFAKDKGEGSGEAMSEEEARALGIKGF